MPKGAILTRTQARAWRHRWDLQQTRLVPARELRFDWMLSTLGVTLGRRFRALDLGCGTGSLSERILTRFPAARVVAIDHDPVLLTVGSRGLGNFGGRLRWIDADLRRSDWTRGLPPGKFDAAVSSTALHWLSPAEIARLYGALGRQIRRGGLFLNADLLGFDPASRRLREVARSVGRMWWASGRRPGESWSAFWRAILHDPGLTDEAALHRARYPRPHTGTPTPDLLGHVRALRRAGFREVEVIWSQWRNRILAAVR